jgi:hypothetical protein
LLPTPGRGVTEYLRIMAFANADAQAAHVTADGGQFAKATAHLSTHPVSTDRYEDDLFTAMVSRDHSWAPETMFSFGFLRFRIPAAGAEDFERDARRQIDMVIENEPGTVLYGFIRRPNIPGGVLPKPVEGIAEYFHFMSYVDAGARELHGQIEHRGEVDLAGPHFTFEGDWAWGTAYRAHLAVPFDGEFIRDSALILAGFSRFSEWKES